MQLIIDIFNELIFRPILNLLMGALDVIPGHDLGVAIIAVTIFVRFVLYPLSYKAAVSQKKMLALKPQLDEVREQHKSDRQKQAQAQMQLYRDNGISLFGGLNLMLIQLPLLFGLFRVFSLEVTPANVAPYLYSFTPLVERINVNFLGLIDLTQPSYVLAVLAGLSQFLVAKMLYAQRKENAPVKPKKKAKKEGPDMQSMLATQTTYVFPFLIVIFASQFAAGLALYWIASSLFSLGQQYLINKRV
ncbi:MAG: YidC/Oxa1 family membrane protein insertase [Candidatus Spechtbacterales bacterium]